jgi:glycosyltransferase involved in cell wall biosynthesis
MGSLGAASHGERPSPIIAVRSALPQIPQTLVNICGEESPILPIAPKRPLKLLFYVPSLAGGGAERLLAQLASALTQRGHDVLFVVDTESAENAGFLESRVRQVQLGPNHFANVLALRHLLREAKPDVSLSVLCGQNLKHMLAAILAGRLSRAVQSYHGFFEGEPRLLSRLSYLLTPLSSRLMARTVCVSETLRTELLRRFHASPGRTIRIYNGVPNARGREIATRSRDDGHPVILACGRFSPDKNFPFLVRAFARMKDPDARLAILGEGPERGSIEAEIARLKLGDRVALPGYCDPAPWYERASCFAMTSKRETFGLVVVEALAAGLAVVTTASGGPEEILQNGRYGRIVRKADERAFAAALDAAVADPGDLVARIARAQEFSMDKCVDAYEALFYEIAR